MKQCGKLFILHFKCVGLRSIPRNHRPYNKRRECGICVAQQTQLKIFLLNSTQLTDTLRAFFVWLGQWCKTQRSS